MRDLASVTVLTLMCKRRAYVCDFMSQEMHLPKNPEDRREMECDGDMEPSFSTSTRSTPTKGQGVSKTAVNLAPIPSARFAFVFFERIIDYGASGIRSASRSRMSALQGEARHWHTKLRSYPKNI